MQEATLTRHRAGGTLWEGDASRERQQGGIHHLVEIRRIAPIPMTTAAASRA